MNRKIVVLGLVFMLISSITVLSGCSSTTNSSSSASGDSSKEIVFNQDDVFSIGLNQSRDYLIIVNEKNAYQFGGAYDKALQNDLIYVADMEGAPTPLEKGANLAFSMLKQRLHSEGIKVELYSGYRTKEDQEWVYSYYSNLEGWAETNKVLEPGDSEHHTGLLLNIVIWGEEDGKMTWITETPERQASHPEFKKVHESLADFGFIDRYPAGKENITGIPHEPYEIRFVGSSKIAHEIMDNNLCLEEYLENK